MSKLDKLKRLCEDSDPCDVVNIRELLSDEYAAISKYGKMAGETKNDNIRKVLQDIQKDEEIHAGILKDLLRREGFPEKEADKKGAKEVKKLIGSETKDDEKV